MQRLLLIKKRHGKTVPQALCDFKQNMTLTAYFFISIICQTFERSVRHYRELNEYDVKIYQNEPFSAAAKDT